ncbi:GDT1 family protein [Haematococcus lacustris]|uniref:GDT1 family protein n=1 Tax=Haematococcus lacustris TaxID=44745 RepID=A0A6A0ADR8_HAELA|nr:GDT1 family protein [Haematococcus lacustris]
MKQSADEHVSTYPTFAVMALSELVKEGARFYEGFAKSFLTILISEIGDKTFFIAAVMAMRNPRTTVFVGALGALAVMTALSAALGWAAPNLISKTYTHYAATALFFFFGLRSLYDAFIKANDGEESELAAVEAELSDHGKSRPAKDSKDSSMSNLPEELHPHLLGRMGGQESDCDYWVRGAWEVLGTQADLMCGQVTSTLHTSAQHVAELPTHQLTAAACIPAAASPVCSTGAVGGMHAA